MPKASEGSKAGRQEAGGFHQGVRVQADVGRDRRALRETQQSKAQGNCWVSQGLDPTYATLDRGDAGGVWFLEHSHDKIRITPFDDCPRLLNLAAMRQFASGMVMGMAQRQLGDDGTLGFRAMLSPDPFMGPRGYPLRFAAGETADGRTLLVDRQHPHDLFMELAGTYSYNLSAKSSLFIYAGLPGEPALSPTPFMHRTSGMDNPEAPISHHWLDSTHI